MTDDLIQQIERLRLEMLASGPKLATPLQQIEHHLIHERDATVTHIRHIASLRYETDNIVRNEREALRSILVPQPAAVPPPLPQDVPDVEERWAPPRFMREAAE
jgi:hypothetical protein